MKKILNSCIFCVFVFYSFSVKGSGPQALINNWNLVGTAELTFLWFDVYKAELKTESGKFDGFNSPLQIVLNYQRDISAEQLLDETDKQLSSMVSQQDRTPWLEGLKLIWPDIVKGDQLIFQTDDNGNGHFFFNKKWVGLIEDEEFSQNFVQIWLGYQSSYPELAKQLRGESF